MPDPRARVERGASGLEPARRCRRVDPAAGGVDGARDTRVGLGRHGGEGRARMRARQRDRARPSARRPRRPLGRDRPRGRRHRRSRGRRRRRSVRARHCVRRDHPHARARVRARERARARRRLHRKRQGDAARARVGDRAGVRRRQHEPLDDEARLRRPVARARRHARTSSARCWSPQRTTCRSRASPGASRASSPSAVTRSADPFTFYSNPTPPVEFFARGLEIDVAWLGGGTLRSTGNSFATPHISGICALILGKHPELTPYQLKSVLHLTASNVRDE